MDIIYSREKSYIAQSVGTILSSQLDYYLLYRYEFNFIATIYVTMAWIQNTGNATVSAFLYSFSQIVIFIENYKLEYSAYLFPNNPGSIGAAHVLLSKIIPLILNIK